jgi:CDP-diacylglycerol---serine O-phosphatidyltransferase
MFERMRHREGRRRRRLRLRRPKLQKPAINRLIPNVLTICALCAGMTAIRFGFEARGATDPASATQLWQIAAFSVIVAAIFDGLDGRMARLLNGTSKFGAELDSLSDFISFGVAPGVVLYMWCLHELGGFGWLVAMLFAACCALRLARFNTALGDPNPPPWTKSYFTGVPAPAGGGLGLLPLFATLAAGPGWADQPWLVAATTILVAYLMVSRIPTFSAKQIKITPPLILPALLAAIVLVGALTSAPWAMFTVCGVIYLLTIPVSVWTQRQARARYQAAPAAAPMQMPVTQALPPGERSEMAQEQKRLSDPERR